MSAKTGIMSGAAIMPNESARTPKKSARVMIMRWRVFEETYMPACLQRFDVEVQTRRPQAVFETRDKYG